jgi:glycerate 2-kinase
MHRLGRTAQGAPMVDGGEGFTKALVHLTGGSLHCLSVTDRRAEASE